MRGGKLTQDISKGGDKISLSKLILSSRALPWQNVAGKLLHSNATTQITTSLRDLIIVYTA